MQIVGYVPQHFALTLRKSCRPNTLLLAESWYHLARILLTGQVDALFLDPLFQPLEDGSVSSCLTQVSHIALVLCVPPSALGCHAIADLSTLKPRSIIVYGTDDHYDQTCDAIAKLVESPSIRGCLFSLVRRRLDRLPASVRSSLQRLFEHPERYLSASDIALDAGVSSTTLYRICESTGWCSPRKILIAARMLRAYERLMDGGSVNHVASELRYRNNKVFSHHSAEVFGMPPSRLRHELPWNAAVNRLTLVLENRDLIMNDERVMFGQPSPLRAKPDLHR